MSDTKYIICKINTCSWLTYNKIYKCTEVHHYLTAGKIIYNISKDNFNGQTFIDSSECILINYNNIVKVLYE